MNSACQQPRFGDGNQRTQQFLPNGGLNEIPKGKERQTIEVIKDKLKAIAAEPRAQVIAKVNEIKHAIAMRN